jgi:hypothetical protein
MPFFYGIGLLRHWGGLGQHSTSTAHVEVIANQQTVHLNSVQDTFNASRVKVYPYTQTLYI